MAKPFAVYVRVSEVGGREGPSFGSPAEQEAAARAWAAREGIDVYFEEEDCVDLDVSGAKAAADRKLGSLIERVESGEFGGIVVKFIDRFGRNMAENAIAHDRVVEAGGRMIATANGYDSANLTPETRMVFNIQSAVAQAVRERNAVTRIESNQRAAERGVYLACKPPVGYVRDHATGRIAPHPKLKKLVVEAFRRRARGETCKALANWLREAGAEIQVPNPKRPKNRKPGDPETVRPLATITEVGVRHMIASRAYLGVATVQSGVKGKPRVITDAHPAIITDAEWESANAVTGAGANTGKLSSQVRLGGIARCPNGHRMKVGHSGGGPSYLCTDRDCDTRSGISALALDDFIDGLLEDAVYAGVPEVVAILQGDTRYERAMDAVAEARAEVEAWRNEVSVAKLGVDAWTEGLEVRESKLDAARDALKATPAPARRNGKAPTLTGTRKQRQAQVAAAYDREAFARFIARIVVKPVGRGRRVHPAERVDVYLVGSETPLDPATVRPVGDPATLAILEAAHTPEALKAARADSARQKAATEKAA